MDTNFKNDAWILSDEGFDVDKQLGYESLYTVGNGYIHQHANFEEFYSAETVLGTSIVGIPIQYDDTEESEAKLTQTINAANWTGINVYLNEEILDLASWELNNFQRSLDMRNGVLKRSFEAISPKGHKIEVLVIRFLSVHQNEIGAIKYSVKSVDFEGRISFMPLIDAKLVNENNETIWNVLQVKTQSEVAHIWTQIRHAKLQTCLAMAYDFTKNNSLKKSIATKIEKENQVGYSVGSDVVAGDTVVMNKYVAVLHSSHYPYKKLPELSCEKALEAKSKSWDMLLNENSEAWSELWKKSNFMLSGNLNVQRKAINDEFKHIQFSLEKQI